MKKVLLVLMITIMLFSTMMVPVSADNTEISVYLNGSKIEFDVPPQIINGRTMVPMRAIFEALGAEVEWDNETRTASGEKMGIVVDITIDDNIMVKNYCDISLDTPAQLVEGRTLVPVRAVSESFAVEVGWDGAAQTVTLTDKNILQSIEISDELIFEGEVKDGKPFGYGTLYEVSDDAESIRMGLWDGLFQKAGAAFETYPDGAEFSGYIVDNSPSGYCEYIYASGKRYEGNNVNFKREGQGKTTWPNGDYYVGNYENDQANGYGEYYFVEGDCYKGNHLNGEPHGYGEYYFADGDCYKGNHLNGEANGYGEYYFANGNYYKGDYVNGVRHGKGVLYDAANNITYEGEFINGNYVQPNNSVPQGGSNSGVNGDVTLANFRSAKFPLYLYSNDGKTYLGKLTTNKYDSESIFNEYGTYGSKYSTKSIFNEYGTYGSKYNTQSAFNPYTTTPPIIVDSNFNKIGYLTANTSKPGGVTILELMQILTTLNQ